jgi:small redox-active disulfide protein 2
MAWVRDGTREESAMNTAVSVIEILGPGCPGCRETYRVVRHVVDESGLPCAIEKNESMERMAQLGVLRTPAIAFDGRLVWAGRIPKSDEVRRLLGVA